MTWSKPLPPICRWQHINRLKCTQKPRIILRNIFICLCDCLKLFTMETRHVYCDRGNEFVHTISMNFTHFKRGCSNSVQDQSWNWRWTEWHRDGFSFDYIGFPLSPSSHQCSILIFILIRLLSEGQADEDWEPDIRKMIAVLAERCFVKNTLLRVGE